MISLHPFVRLYILTHGFQQLGEEFESSRGAWFNRSYMVDLQRSPKDSYMFDDSIANQPRKHANFGFQDLGLDKIFELIMFLTWKLLVQTVL